MKKRIHFINGRIYSMAEEGSVFSAMTAENGRITALDNDAVGSRFAGRKRWKEKVVDLQGQTVIPSFTDSHVHFLTSATLNEFALKISFIQGEKLFPERMADVGLRLKEYVRSRKRDLVLGFNMVTSGLAERRMPSAAELDEWLPGKLVIIIDSSGHSSAYSSKAIHALELEGIHENGLLLGEAHESNMGRINKLVLKYLSPAILLKGISAFVNRNLACGITGIHCMEGFDDDPRDIGTRLFARLARILPIDILLYCQYRSPDRVKPFRRFLAYPRLGGCGAWEMDGAVSAGTAAFYDNYRNPSDSNGSCYYSDEIVQAMVERAHKAGFQIAAHAIGPRAIEPLLSAMEKTLAEDPEVTPSNQNPYRHRIEHFEFPTPDQMKRTVQAGIPVVVQAGWTWMDTRYQQSYAFRLTDDQIAGQVALRTIADLGGIICGSSDSPIQDPDPFIQIQGMIDFPVEGQSLTRWEAVRAYTANAAWAGFQEEEKGTLEPGKRADFIVLDKDIFDESVFIPAIKVTGVYTGGHIVKPVNYTLLTILPKLLWGKKKRI